MDIVGMKDAGRSWTEIAERTGLSVAQCKAAVTEAKTARRSALAHTVENERARGLLDPCFQLIDFALCTHLRKEHGENGCAKCGCPAFTGKADPQYRPDVRYRYPNDVGRALTRIGKRVPKIGLMDRWHLPTPQMAKPATRLRRARRRGLV